jgi:hypothetical protein
VNDDDVCRRCGRPARDHTVSHGPPLPSAVEAELPGWTGLYCSPARQITREGRIVTGQEPADKPEAPERQGNIGGAIPPGFHRGAEKPEGPWVVTEAEARRRYVDHSCVLGLLFAPVGLRVVCGTCGWFVRTGRGWAAGNGDYVKQDEALTGLLNSAAWKDEQFDQREAERRDIERNWP